MLKAFLEEKELEFLEQQRRFLNRERDSAKLSFKVFEFRRRHLLRQSNAAAILGISRRTFQMIERGKIKTQPHSETLDKINARMARYDEEHSSQQVA